MRSQWYCDGRLPVQYSERVHWNGTCVCLVRNAFESCWKTESKEVTWLDEGRLRENPVALTSSCKIIGEVPTRSNAAIQHTAVWHKNGIQCDENPQQSYNINQQIAPLLNYYFNYSSNVSNPRVPFSGRRLYAHLWYNLFTCQRSAYTVAYKQIIPTAFIVACKQIIPWFLVNDQRDAQILFYVSISIFNSLHVSSTQCLSSGETNFYQYSLW